MYQVKSISQFVRELIVSATIYREMLESGIANLTALAERIKPEIEAKAQTEVNTNTIVAALKRVAENISLTKASLESREQFTGDFQLTLDDSVINLGFETEKRSEVMSLFDEIMKPDDDIAFLVQTSNKYNVFTKNTRLYEVTKQLLSEGPKNPLDEKFSTVTLKFTTVQMKKHLSSLMFEISRLLYNSGVELYSAFFTPTEIVLNLSNADSIKLYEILSTDLIKNKKYT